MNRMWWQQPQQKQATNALNWQVHYSPTNCIVLH